MSQVRCRRLSWSWMLLLVCGGLAQADEPAKPVDYLSEIKPLLTSRCTACHGAETQKSGFRVDSSAALIQGGDTGEAIVPGKPDESLLIHAVTGTNGVTKMPPKDPRLTDAEIALLKRWIQEGAKAPADEAAPTVIKNRDHWSFQPIKSHPLPKTQRTDWVRNDIDAFVLAKLESEGLAPSPEAERVTLIRRLSLDLLGLPPSPEEVTAFVNDTSNDAYERLVDHLLSSPHYGERMARQWLDLARYADSNGFTRDQPRVIWKYRDWVINAFNANMPFDQFAVEQIAGDMLPNATIEQRIATGFHRNTLFNEEGGTDPEQFRIESVVDRTNTTSAVFLGLTVGCAQCHDHKYDPISQREYYQLFAFLNNADEPKLDVPSSEQIASGAFEKRDQLHKKIKELEAEFEKQKPEFEAALAEWEKTVATEESRKGLPILVVNGLQLGASMRNPENIKPLVDYFKSHEVARKKFPQLQQISELRGQEPTFITTLVMKERTEPRETFIHIRGDFLRHGIKVSAAPPAVLPPLPKEITQPNRLDFARWLVSANNPLTPRVTVNRLWQKFFGRGLVDTENDFGLQGTPPTHPELLDWLAGEFVAKGWNIKAIQRTIVLSAAYRQASKYRDDLAEMDPSNKLYGRQSRLRLDAELIRDVALASSGLLARVVGGPSVYPPQPEGVFDFTQDKKPWVAATGTDRFRRGMYTYLWRSSPYPAMTVFDFPDANIACTRRSRSNTPLQSLTLANDQTFVEFAQGLAKRVLTETNGDDAARMQAAFKWCFSRPPSTAEQQRLLKMLEEQRTAFTTDVAQKFAPPGLPASIAPAEAAAWTAVARVLINLDEFITRE